MSGKDSLQIAMAVASCRFSRQLLHRLNRGGTSLPGKLAMWFRRDILAITSEGVETILVTGTNGKTTTAAMLSHAMEEAGRAPLCNRSGANLLSGVTAEFAAAADLRGRPLQGRKIPDQHADADMDSGLYAVVECDEGALRHVAPLLKPRVIVVTNLFRDQLDRYGEVMHTLEAVREGIRLVPEAALCLNADDSLVASLALDSPNPVIWFGMEETTVKTAVQEIQNTSTADKKVLREESGTAQERQDAVNTVDKGDKGRFFVSSPVETKTRPLSPDPPEKISDARYCIRCGTEYIYRYHTYAHLGGFCCPSCGFSRTVPDVAVSSIDGIDIGGSRVHMRVRGRESVHREIVPQERVSEESVSQELPVRIALPAVYNIYNAAAALAAYSAARLPIQEILEGLAGVHSSFGRMEHFVIGGVSVQMILVKNPAGCNQALDYLCALEEPCTLVLCLNDLDADGHDISWIWDVDYEKLCGRGNIRRILVWGKRAEDLQLRLKYAGLQEKRIRRVPQRKLKKLLEAIYKSQVPVFILPNYTTMLPLRDALRRAAGKDSFWKG